MPSRNQSFDAEFSGFMAGAVYLKNACMRIRNTKRIIQNKDVKTKDSQFCENKRLPVL
jgi:hypothetical protein